MQINKFPARITVVTKISFIDSTTVPMLELFSSFYLLILYVISPFWPTVVPNLYQKNVDVV